MHPPEIPNPPKVLHRGGGFDRFLYAVATAFSAGQAYNRITRFIQFYATAKGTYSMDMPTAQSLRLPQRLSALRAPLEQFLSAAVGFVMSGASILLAAAPFGVAMGGSCAARLRCFRHPWGDGRISDAFRRQRHAALSRGTGSAVRAALGARFYPKEPDSVLYPAACGACHCCDRAGRGPLRTLDRLRLCAGRLRSGDHRDGGDALRQGEPLSSGGRAADTRQRSLHRRGACDPLHGILGVPDRRVLPGADAGLLLPAALRMLPFDRGGCAAAIAAGLVAALAGQPQLLAVYCASGLAAGVFAPLGRVGSCVSMSAGAVLALLAQRPQSPAAVLLALECAGAAALFLLTPGETVRKLGLIRNEGMASGEMLRRVVVARLARMGRRFPALGL